MPCEILVTRLVARDESFEVSYQQSPELSPASAEPPMSSLQLLHRYDSIEELTRRKTSKIL